MITSGIKISAVSDIHYSQGNRKELTQLVAKINRQKPDVFIFGGDVSQRTDKDFIAGIKLLGKIKAKEKLFVCGNHDLFHASRPNSYDALLARFDNYLNKSNHSLLFYKKELGRIVRKYGFHYLDGSPKIIGKYGFVGNMGWYDYSMKPKIIADGSHFCIDGVDREYSWQELGEYEFAKKSILIVDKNLSQEDQQKKLETMFSDANSLHVLAGIGIKGKDIDCSVSKRIMQYSDGQSVFLGMSDKEFLETRLTKIRNQLDWIKDRCETIIFTSHMLPFKEIVIGCPEDSEMSFRAVYNGSVKIGKLLQEYGLEYALHGHSINTIPFYGIGDITCVNIHYKPNKSPTILYLK